MRAMDGLGATKLAGQNNGLEKRRGIFPTCSSAQVDRVVQGVPGSRILIMLPRPTSDLLEPSGGLV